MVGCGAEHVTQTLEKWFDARKAQFSPVMSDRDCAQ
jgi:hypothetical protein